MIIIKINFIQFWAMQHWIMNKAYPVWKQVILYETLDEQKGNQEVTLHDTPIIELLPQSDRLLSVLPDQDKQIIGVSLRNHVNQ